jgi:hypothetical protein
MIDYNETNLIKFCFKSRNIQNLTKSKNAGSISVKSSKKSKKMQIID